mmetsp:Transcript_37212/g.66411  ORF Transcript_37212/g.66411 Transcript_37212/m.66411 type:complete len:81 (+) Transcript_37212:24-266(+)
MPFVITDSRFDETEEEKTVNGGPLVGPEESEEEAEPEYAGTDLKKKKKTTTKKTTGGASGGWVQKSDFEQLVKRVAYAEE